MRHSLEITRQGTKKSTKINHSQNQIPPYESNYQAPEAIIKSLLDKIITISLYQAYSKEIAQNLGPYCFDKLKKK